MVVHDTGIRLSFREESVALIAVSKVESWLKAAESRSTQAIRSSKEVCVDLRLGVYFHLLKSSKQ